jgi:hypothetical protein
MEWSRHRHPMKRFLGIAVALLLSGPAFAVSADVRMSGRVITPNGDGINDHLILDIPTGMDHPQAWVYSAAGRRVASLVPVGMGRLAWDGRDASGRSVESGVYLLQISQDAALWSGVVSVAR